MRLKQELDSILNLQAELDSLDKSIEATKRALSQGKSPLEASHLLPELTITGDKLRTQADQIYDSLNVQNRFPELKKCSFEFVRILLILHDLKINIRKRVVGSFFEWDKLDQAVGGRQQTIGHFNMTLLCLADHLLRDQNTSAHKERHNQTKARIACGNQQVQYPVRYAQEVTRPFVAIAAPKTTSDPA